MPIDFDQKMLDENDEPIKVAANGKEATLRDLLLVALAVPDQKQEDKKSRWAAIKALKSGSTELSVHHLDLCKKWADKAFLSPVVTGRIEDALNV